MPAVRLKTFEVDERRRNVAALLLRRIPQWQIAEQLSIKPYTVSRDATALLRAWRLEAGAATVEIVARELAELDALEYDCALQFSKTKDVEWVHARLRIKQRRAKLLGLDDPEVHQLIGPDGGPIEVVQSGAAIARQVLADPELLRLSRQMTDRQQELDQLRDRDQIGDLNGHRTLPSHPRFN